MKNSKRNLIVAMLIFGSIGLFVKNINVSSSQIALVRGLIGSLFLLAASFITKKKTNWKAIKPNLLLLTASGAAIGFNWIFLFEAYKFTSIANATLSYYFAPIFVMFLSPLILKERLTVTKIISIFSAMLGMFLVVGTNSGSISEQNIIGIGYGLIAAALYASVILMNKFLKGLTGLESTFIQLSIASITLLPYVLMTQEVQLSHLDMKSWILLLTVGIIHTGFAYLLYFSSMQNLKGQTIAVYSYIDPISAILMSSVFLGEKMTIIQGIGAILILGATLLSEIRGNKTNFN